MAVPHALSLPFGLSPLLDSDPDVTPVATGNYSFSRGNLKLNRLTNQIDRAVKNVLRAFEGVTLPPHWVDKKAVRQEESGDAHGLQPLCEAIDCLLNLAKTEEESELLHCRSLSFLDAFTQKARAAICNKLTEEIKALEEAPHTKRNKREICFLELQREDVLKNGAYLVEPLKAVVNGAADIELASNFSQELRAIDFITDLFLWATMKGEENGEIPEAPLSSHQTEITEIAAITFEEAAAQMAPMQEPDQTQFFQTGTQVFYTHDPDAAFLPDQAFPFQDAFILRQPMSLGASPPAPDSSSPFGS